MSSWSLFYYDEVRFDIRDAKEWYRKKQAGLEKRFASSVKETILRLQETPLIYQPRYKYVRVAYTPIFPYAVHFYLNESLKQIVIIAIVHQHRNPEHLKQRL